MKLIFRCFSFALFPLFSLTQRGADEIYYETGDEDSPAVSGHQALGEDQGKVAERLRGQAGSRWVAPSLRR